MDIEIQYVPLKLKWYQKKETYDEFPWNIGDIIIANTNFKITEPKFEIKFGEKHSVDDYLVKFFIKTGDKFIIKNIIDGKFCHVSYMTKSRLKNSFDDWTAPLLLRNEDIPKFDLMKK